MLKLGHKFLALFHKSETDLDVMIEARYIHKKVKEWKSLQEYADKLGMTADQMRNAALENVDVGYLNVQGEYIGPAFSGPSNPLMERSKLNPAFEVGVVCGPIESARWQYFTFNPVGN